MNRRSIVEQVLLRMDEVSPFGNSQAIQGFPVEKFLNQAAIDMLFMLPSHISKVQVTPEELPLLITEGYADGCGAIEVAADFLKLDRLRLAEWLRPVTHAIKPTDAEYMLQHNRYTRGGIAKPVVAEVMEAGKLRLEVYSYKSNNEVAQFSYVPKMLPEELPDTLIEPLSWLAASVCYLAMEQPASNEMAMVKFNQFTEIR